MSDETAHVLLVEDDEIDVAGIRHAFRKLKIANPITTASDGLEALEVLRGKGDNKPLPAPYVILLDLNTPRMNGLEFLEELRRDPKLQKAIVFVLTTSRSDEDMTASYRKNIAGYIVKEEAGQSFVKLVELLDHYWRIVELPGN